jgi:polysaccharide export outer membrane protein
MPRLLLAIALAVLLLAPSRLAAEAAYLLQRGDRVDVTVYGHADLSGPLTLDHAGAVALPIGGSVPAAGLSAQQLERRITDILGGGYIIRPQVTVRIAELRPVYVLGAVRNAGAVAYRPGMTALAAIALAGGLGSTQHDTPALRATLLEAEQREAMLLTQRIAARARISRLAAQRDDTAEIHFPADLDDTDPAIARLLETEREVVATERQAVAGQLAVWISRLAAAETERAALANQIQLEHTQLASVAAYHADLVKLHRRGLVDRRRLVEMQMEEARIRATLARLETETGRADQTVKEVPLRLAEIRAAARQRALAALQEAEARLSDLDSGIAAARELAEATRQRILAAGGSTTDGTLRLTRIDAAGAGPHPIDETASLRPGDIVRVAGSMAAHVAAVPAPSPTPRR